MLYFQPVQFFLNAPLNQFIVKPGNIFFIVDDDPDDQELFIEALKGIDEFCRCFSAFDGKDALEKLVNDMPALPDFIFLDLNMPRMNGKEFLSKIKKDIRLRDIPVIIYSTSSLKKDMEEAGQLGAVFFLQKPNSFDELSKALSGIVLRNWN